MHYLQETFAVLKQADRLGSRVLENGTRLIGHVPHVGPEAWLHKIFAPISDRQIDELENDVAIKLPEVFRDFLTLTNGLSMFSGNLSIYGLRSSWERTGDAAGQPFSIVTPNTVERLVNAKKSFLFLGGYRSGKGYYLYIDTNDLAIYRCSRQSAIPLQKWNSFPEMLVCETTRLAALFDERGRRIDPTQPVV
jgi:hypothetical protein